MEIKLTKRLEELLNNISGKSFPKTSLKKVDESPREIYADMDFDKIDIRSDRTEVIPEEMTQTEADTLLADTLKMFRSSPETALQSHKRIDNYTYMSLLYEPAKVSK